MKDSGDGICESPEGPDTRLEDCLNQEGAADTGQQSLEIQAGEEHWVANPASGV